MYNLQELARETGIPSSFIQSLQEQGKVDYMRGAIYYPFTEGSIIDLQAYFNNSLNAEEYDSLRYLPNLDYLFLKAAEQGNRKTFYNEDRNVLLVMLPTTEGDLADLNNNTFAHYYNRLTETLNTENNLVVIWEKNDHQLSKITVFKEVNSGLFSEKAALDIATELFEGVTFTTSESIKDFQYGEVTNKVWTNFSSVLV